MAQPSGLRPTEETAAAHVIQQDSANGPTGGRPTQGLRDLVGHAAFVPDIEFQMAGALGLIDVMNHLAKDRLPVGQESQPIARQSGYANGTFDQLG